MSLYSPHLVTTPPELQDPVLTHRPESFQPSARLGWRAGTFLHFFSSRFELQVPGSTLSSMLKDVCGSPFISLLTSGYQEFCQTAMVLFLKFCI